MRPRTLSFILSLVVLALALLCTGSIARAQSFARIATIEVPPDPKNPDGQLRSFDVAFVDGETQRLYVTDRSNFGVDVFNTEDNTFVGRFGGFAGPLPDNRGGPNGAVVVHDEGRNQLWAGDGDSTVKVVDLESGEIIDSIDTGGEKRVDALAFDDEDHIVLAVNDTDNPPFVTFISTKDDHEILGKIEFPQAPDGLQKPTWDPVSRRFYFTIPSATVNPGGEIDIIDPVKMEVTDIFALDDCKPHQLAFGPRQQLLVACNQQRTLVVDATTGDVLANITDVGGTDAAVFNPGDGNYYLAANNNSVEFGGPVLGIIDSETITFIESVPTRTGAHAVAADPVNNHVFVPLGANPMAEDCNDGCIGVYASVDPSSPGIKAAARSRR